MPVAIEFVHLLVTVLLLAVSAVKVFTEKNRKRN